MELVALATAFELESFRARLRTAWDFKMIIGKAAVTKSVPVFCRGATKAFQLRVKHGGYSHRASRAFLRVDIHRKYGKLKI